MSNNLIFYHKFHEVGNKVAKIGEKRVQLKKEEKTNVMRVLDGKKISYESHAYEPDPTLSGEDIADIV